MIIESSKKEKDISLLNFPQMILFGLAVSIDSFSIGIGLNGITNNYILSSIIFSSISCFFTFAGLKLGKYINDKIGKLSTIIGGIILMILGLLYLLKTI